MTLIHESADTGLFRRWLRIYRELRCDCGVPGHASRTAAASIAWRQAVAAAAVQRRRQ